LEKYAVMLGGCTNLARRVMLVERISIAKQVYLCFVCVGQSWNDMQNIEELQRAATQQQQQCEDLEAHLSYLQDNQQGLDKQVQEASEVWCLTPMQTAQSHWIPCKFSMSCVRAMV